MPVNGFSVGKDVSLVIKLSSGTLTLAGLTSFSRKPSVTKISSKLITGLRKTGTIPDGWQGSFKLDRFDSTVDDFWAAFEAGYFNGDNQPSGTIYETIKEASGAITKWRYEDVTLSFDDAGDFAGDKRVEQTISFEASRRKKVA